MATVKEKEQKEQKKKNPESKHEIPIKFSFVKLKGHLKKESK